MGLLFSFSVSRCLVSAYFDVLSDYFTGSSVIFGFFGVSVLFRISGYFCGRLNCEKYFRLRDDFFSRHSAGGLARMILITRVPFVDSQDDSDI